MLQSNSYFFCCASVLLLKAKTYWSDKKRLMRSQREMASRQKLKTINVSTAIALNRLKPAKWERRARSRGGSQLHLLREAFCTRSSASVSTSFHLSGRRGIIDEYT